MAHAPRNHETAPMDREDQELNQTAGEAEPGASELSPADPEASAPEIESWLELASQSPPPSAEPIPVAGSEIQSEAGDKVNPDEIDWELLDALTTPDQPAREPEPETGGEAELPRGEPVDAWVNAIVPEDVPESELGPGGEPVWEDEAPSHLDFLGETGPPAPWPSSDGLDDAIQALSSGEWPAPAEGESADGEPGLFGPLDSAEGQGEPVESIWSSLGLNPEALSGDSHDNDAYAEEAEALSAWSDPSDDSFDGPSWAEGDDSFDDSLLQYRAPEPEAEPTWAGPLGEGYGHNGDGLGPAAGDDGASVNGSGSSEALHLAALAGTNGHGKPAHSKPEPEPSAPASSLELRRIEPASSGDDQPVTYGFVVRNTAPVSLSNVRFEHTVPEGARCIGVSPRPEVFDSGKTLIWHLGDLEAGAERTFLVRVQKDPGVELPTETTAILHACYHLKAAVARPRLVVQVEGPEAVRRGEPAAFHIEIKNTGTAPARGLTIVNLLPTGLEHPEGDRVEARLGNLAAGEALQLTLRTTAVEAGQQALTVNVSADDGHRASARAEVQVTEASLHVRASAVVRCAVEHTAEFQVEVLNTGTAGVGQTLLIDTLPEELEFLGASGDPVYDAADRSLTWNLGAMPPGDTRSVSVKVLAKLPGDFTHRLLAWSDCGLDATAEATVISEIDNAQSSHLLEDLLATIDREDEAAAANDAPPAEGQGPLAPRRSGSGPGRQHVVFTMGQTDYAVPIEGVREYGHPLSVTPVPNVPDWVLGVANLHGDIISMVDLRRFLGLDLADDHRDGRMLVVRARREDLTVGLIVDRVKGIRLIPDDRVGPPTSQAEDGVAPYLLGVAEHQGRLLALLDLDRLLLSPEMRQFEPV